MASKENLHNVADVFQMFHDGIIAEYEGDNSLLRVTIECQYLAEIVNPEFEFFYIDLIEVTKFDLDAYQNPIDLPPFILHGYEEALKAELDILYTDVKDDLVEISCNQTNLNYNYCGGILRVKCEGIQIFDQNLNKLTVDELDVICNSYWNRARD